MSNDPIDRLEAWAQKAEDAWRRGDLAAARRHYAAGVGERLAHSAYGVDAGATLEAADFVVFERLSDLARLFGEVAEADQLLASAVKQISAAGNQYWADLLRVKRIDLALGSGCPRTAQAMLNEMRPSIGDVEQIRFTGVGLEQWERHRYWPNADENDRATIFALLYLVIGRTLAALGQYGQAEGGLRRGLAHAESPGADGRAAAGAPELLRRAVGPLRLALATALLEKGELQSAAEQLGQLRLPKAEEGGPAAFVQTLELQGKLDLLAGEFGSALKIFRQVFDMCVRHGFVRAAVAATLNLAHVLIFLNQTLDARRRLLLAHEVAQGSGDLALVARAEWLLQLASARAQSLADGVPIARSVTEQWGHGAPGRQNSLGAQLPMTDDAPPESRVDHAFAHTVNPLELPPSDNYLAYFEECALGFHWLLGLRDFGACADYLAELKLIFSHSDSGLIKLRLRVLSGMLAYYGDDFEQAEELLSDARTELSRLRLLPELWQAQRILGWCLMKLGRDEVTQEELATETSRLLVTMADTLSQEDRSFFLLNKWTAEEEELAARINRLSKMKQAADAAPWYRRWRLRRQLTAQLNGLLRTVDYYRDINARRTTRAPVGDLAATGGHGHELPDIPPPPLWGRLLRRIRRRATISFLVLPDRVLVVYGSRSALDFGVSPATRIEVRELVRQWHEIIAQITGRRARGLGQTPSATAAPGEEMAASVEAVSEAARLVAERLSALLQLPSALDSLPRSTRTLTLVADDSLHGFPFAVIMHRGQYLIKRYALAYAYSSDEQEDLARQSNNRRALLVGASSGGGEWAELEFVSEELDRVAGWATRRNLAVQRIDDSGPTQAAPDKVTVLAALPRSTFAHVACHGLFTPDQPARSGIVLRPAQRPDVLNVQELSALDLTNLRHVTLSACWSADHFILPGRWVISLPETLSRAGAASVLGCLWLVDDRVSKAFMAHFYRCLDQHARAKALQLTQLAFLTGDLKVDGAPDTTQPIFWAGYQLYGRADKLKL